MLAQMSGEPQQQQDGPPPPPWRPDPADLSVLENGCGLIDRSYKGRLTLTGEDAASLLQGQVSNDMEALQVGHGCEAGLLTPKGKLLGIVRVLRTGETEFHLTTDRISLQELFDTLRRAAVGHSAEIGKATLETAQLSLVGPKADRIAGISDLPQEYMNRQAMLGGSRVMVVVTDEGVDVICPTEKQDGVKTALLAAGAVEGDEAAAQCLRVQAGIPLYGVDINESTIPQEADLNHRLVSFTKGCYVGQETVARLYYRGSPNRVLRGLLLDDEVTPGTVLTDSDGKEVGVVGSVSAPPGDAVTALAVVRVEASPGKILSAAGLEAEVVELPFPVLDSPSGAA
jgi:folate-binding protein YgfZ